MLPGNQSGTSDRKFRVVHDSEKRRIAVCENVVFTSEDEEPDIAYLDELLRVLKSVGQQHRNGLAVLFSIGENCKPPSEEVRARIVRDRSQFGHYVRASAHVIHGSGFSVAAKRGVLTLLFAAARMPFTTKVFGENEPAARWLLSALGDAAPQTITPGDLALMVRQNDIGK